MKQKTILVIGVGNLGRSLVETLWDHGVQTIVVDNRREAVDDVKSRTSAAFVGDGVDPGVLESIGAAEADAAVVTFGENFEAAVLCVATLKRLGLKDIVARASSRRQAEVLRTVGATRTLQLEAEMGRRLAIEIVTPVASDLMDFASGFRVLPWRAHGALVGKSLAEAEIRRHYQVSVIGVRRAAAPGVSTTRFEAIAPDYIISEGDTLLLVGEDESVSRFVSETSA